MVKLVRGGVDAKSVMEKMESNISGLQFGISSRAMSVNGIPMSKNSTKLRKFL